VADRSLADLRRALARRGMLVPNGGGFDHRWVASGGRLINAKVWFAFGSQRVGTFIASPKQENLFVLKELIETGKVTPVIDRTYSLNETAEAVRYVGTGHARGKVIVSINGITS
jgi:NADPH:quinone reductase-like Zn-dependent oxidoreductase